MLVCGSLGARALVNTNGCDGCLEALKLHFPTTGMCAGMQPSPQTQLIPPLVSSVLYNYILAMTYLQEVKRNAVGVSCDDFHDFSLTELSASCS